MKKLVFIFLGILTTYYLLLTTVFAQTPGPLNITESPSVFDLTARPGDTITKSFRIRNNNATPLPLAITVRKLVPDSNGNIHILDFKKSDDYGQWLTFSQSSFTAAPREWTTLTFTLTIPKTAAFGYYWDVFLSVNSSSQKVTSPGAQITGAVGLPILLSVQSNGTNVAGQLLNFVTDSHFYEYLPVTFLTTYQNNGNVHVKPTGNIFITDSLNNQVATLQINKDLGSVLPKSKRVFSTVWDDSFITYGPKMEDGQMILDKNNKPEMEMQFHFDRVLNLRIGKYTASALVVVSGDNRDYSFQQTTTFFVFPWKIILGLILFVLLAGFGLWNVLANIWHHGRRVLKI